jgi:hypothetical protein
MSDRTWQPQQLPLGWKDVRARRSSRYLTMRDGVRIAVEVFVPDPLAAPAPTILRQTRYMRALEPRLPWPVSLATKAFRLRDRALHEEPVHARSRSVGFGRALPSRCDRSLVEDGDDRVERLGGRHREVAGSRPATRPLLLRAPDRR